MRARLVLAVVLGVGLSIPLGSASAQSCDGAASLEPRLMFALDANDTAMGTNSTFLYSIGDARLAHLCPEPNPQPWPPSRPPAPAIEPAWPAFNWTKVIVLSSRHVQVEWSTNVPAVARVAWGGLGDARSGAANIDDFSLEHHLRLQGLEPGRTYVLHITAFDARARAEVSRELWFTMPPPPRDVVGDVLLVGLSVAATFGVCERLRRPER